MPPTPAAGSRMQADTHEPSTVVSITAASALTAYWPCSTWMREPPGSAPASAGNRG